MKEASSFYGGKPKVMKVSTGVQSDYRENDAQTEPWTPKFRVINGRPEVLTLGFMKYHRDLPAWRRTVDTIEFMRKKRAWETYLVHNYTLENAEYFKRILTDIEKCEMMLMEDDFDRKNKKRLELAAKEAEYFNYMMDLRFKERDQFVTSEIAKKKEDKVRSIRAKKTRELRKIDMKERGVNMKYHHLTPVEEMCDPLSPFHVSVARFGKNPRYATEILSPETRISSMSAYRTVEEALMRKSVSALPPKKKTVPKKHDCSLVKDEELPDDESPLPEPLLVAAPQLELDDDGSALIPAFPSPHQEKDYQAVLLLQTLIRGRAVQNLMYKGRTKNQAIVDEIQSTVALFKEEEIEVDLKRRQALQRLRYYHLNMKLMGLVALVQQEMMGEGIADLALKSYHEVERMTEESRGYLMAQLAERTRWHREAAESGRRQRELRRRDLYDEFFRHLTRRNEITSNDYLKLITDSVIRSISEKEADFATRLKADEIEKQDIKDASKKKHDIVVRRELMARLLHDFYIPQIAKNMERYSLDYYIGKARKTAIDVILGKAKEYYAQPKETSLMELVTHQEGDIYPPQSPNPSSQQSTPDTEERVDTFTSTDSIDVDDEEFAKRIEFLDEFMKQQTMSVIEDAEQFGKEAEMFKNIIIKQLRDQEDEKRKSLTSQKKYSKENTDECYDRIYKYGPHYGSGQAFSGTPRENASDATVPSNESPAEEEPALEEEEVGSVSMSSSATDIIDRRLLVNSDSETTTDSEEVEDTKRRKMFQEYGDLPDRMIDELLMQAQVIHAQHDPEEVGGCTDELVQRATVGTKESRGSEQDVQQAPELDEELERALARQRYLDWRDNSDLSNITWSYQAGDDTEHLTQDEITTEEEEEAEEEY